MAAMRCVLCFDRRLSGFCSVCVFFGRILVEVLLNNCLDFDRIDLGFFIFFF